MENAVAMDKFTNSDSSVQCEIENILFRIVQSELNLKLEQNPIITLTKNSDIKIQPDFYSYEAKVIGEIHSHIGKLKPSQFDKIAADILKMILLEKDFGEKFSKYIVVCSDDEKRQLQGNSFLAEAIRQLKIEILFYELSESDNIKLENTIKKQNLMNIIQEN